LLGSPILLCINYTGEKYSKTKTAGKRNEGKYGKIPRAEKESEYDMYKEEREYKRTIGRN